jgi:hypothetical protein
MGDRHHPDPRRPEFDEIANGWGFDSRIDLVARIELLAEFVERNGGKMSFAEQKVSDAMRARVAKMTDACV